MYSFFVGSGHQREKKIVPRGQLYPTFIIGNQKNVVHLRAMNRTITQLLLAVLLALAPSNLFGQQGPKVKVSGTVVDGESGEPLIGVTVLTETFSGVTTYIDGSYNIEAEAGTSLTYSYMGTKFGNFT